MSTVKRTMVRLVLTGAFGLSAVSCAAIVGIHDATEEAADGSTGADGGTTSDSSTPTHADGSAADVSTMQDGDASGVTSETSTKDGATGTSDGARGDVTVADASIDSAPVGDSSVDATFDVADSTLEDGDAMNDSGSTPGIDGALDAGPFDGSADSSDSGGTDLCSIRTYDDTLGIFVSSTGTDGVGCGTRAQPCLTVATALSQANALGKPTVYVATGTYEEALSLAQPVTIEGTWSASGPIWTPACESNVATVIQAPPSATTTVLLDSINGSAAIRWLQITSKPASEVAYGESIYGIMAIGSSTTLLLDSVVVVASPAGDGAAGSAGIPGLAATDAGCEDDGATGAQGAVGASSAGGIFNSFGYLPGNGLNGDFGLSGASGTAGGAADCATCGTCLDSHCQFVPSGAGTICGSQGLAGCGGGGGVGGLGGHGGGSSIALYVWGATVTSRGSSFVAGSGGTGGAGGPGGGGGAPSGGVPGTPATCLMSCSFPITDAGTCTTTYASEEGGAAGGTGGPGGGGGQGGGGAGGWSCGVYLDTTGTLSEIGSTFTLGDAGAGGSPAGAAGLSAGLCRP